MSAPPHAKPRQPFLERLTEEERAWFDSLEEADDLQEGETEVTVIPKRSAPKA